MRMQECRRASVVAVLLCALSTGTPALAGSLYVSQNSNNLIVTYNTMVSPPTSMTFASTGLSGPVDLAFDSAGNLYATNNSGNTIEKFTPGGVGSFFASVANPYGLAVDSAGNVFVSHTVSGVSSIEKLTPAGVGSVFVSTGVSGPTGLAFDSAGNLYVANNINNTIERFTPGGVGSVFASTGVSHPYGLAFDSAGNLYVANNPGTGELAGDNTIERFTPGGVGSVFANFGPGESSGPTGLAFDSVGNLFVTINGMSLIEKFTPDGVGSVFATNPNGLFLGLVFRADAVPEPSSLVLMGLGGLVLLGTHLLCRENRWRKRKSSA